MKYLFIATILTVVVLIFISGQQGCEMQEEEIWTECFTDADCLKVQLTCCPCSTGGMESCVPETLAPLYEENLKKCPPENESICIAVNNCKITECYCVKGTCQEKK